MQSFGGRAGHCGDHTSAWLVREPDGGRVHSAVGGADPALHEYLLDPGAPGQRRHGGLQCGELIQGRVDGWPDVQKHVVHVEPQAGRAPGGANAPYRLQAAGDRTLGVGQRCHVPVSIAHHRHLADLCERDEPLVGRVLRGDAVVEQDVFRGVQAGDIEVAQSPQVEPAADHGVDASH